MVANAESPFFKVTLDVKENVKEVNITNPTMPLTNIINECLAVEVKEILKPCSCTSSHIKMQQ